MRAAWAGAGAHGSCRGNGMPFGKTVQHPIARKVVANRRYHMAHAWRTARSWRRRAAMLCVCELCRGNVPIVYKLARCGVAAPLQAAVGVPAALHTTAVARGFVQACKAQLCCAFARADAIALQGLSLPRVLRIRAFG